MRKNRKEKSIMQSLAQWARQSQGAIAMYMALMVPVLTGGIGMGIDLAETYMVKERLVRALDAAALAAAGSSGLTVPQMQTRVDAFMAANYPPQKIGVAYQAILTKNGDFVTVTGSADYNTAFLRLIGFDTLGITAHTTVQLQVQGIEVAMVLDNTGSMADSYQGTTKIAALKSAATTFVQTMFTKATNPLNVRIGVVPYANSVRVGLYGLGQIPDPVTGLNKGIYNNGNIFITLPPGMNYSTNHDTSTKTNWYGCVVEHNSTGYDPLATTTNNTSSSGDRGQIWTRNGNYNGHGWDPSLTTEDPSPNDVTDSYTGPWDVYNYGNVTSACQQYNCIATYTSGPNKGKCKTYGSTCQSYSYGFSTSSAPNNGCPYANVLPLSSDQTAIDNLLNTMAPHGSTESNVGMLWGYRLLSPEQPFTEGSAWGSLNWKKAIILMTDGDNTRDGTYSYYWASAKNQIQAHTALPAYPNVLTLDARLTKVCQALKDKNVLVYTILFDVFGDITPATKSVYQNCATNSNMYFDAPSNTALAAVFDQIARELSNLHISQ